MKWITAFIYGLVILAIYHYFMSSEIISSPGVLNITTPSSATSAISEAQQLEHDMNIEYRKIKQDDLDFSGPANINEVGAQPANIADGYAPAMFNNNITDVNAIYQENPNKFFHNVPGAASPPSGFNIPGAPGTAEAMHNVNLYQAYMQGHT